MLCDSPDEVIASSDVIVVGNQSPEFAEVLTRCGSGHTVIDLVRVPSPATAADYRGICW